MSSNTLSGMKRKYGTSKFAKKTKKAYSGGQGKFLRGQNRVIRLGRGPERKVIDTASANYACDTTGSVTFVNGCAQGTDFNQCIGRKYRNVAIQLEGYVGPSDSNTSANKCRVMLVYDEQPNGAVPAITDILTASTSAAFMNLNNRDRFKILADENFVIGGFDTAATAAYAMSPTVQNVSIWRKIDLPTIRNGAATSAAVTNYQTGTLLLVTIGAVPAAVGSTLTAAVRVRFEDD